MIHIGVKQGNIVYINDYKLDTVFRDYERLTKYINPSLSKDRIKTVIDSLEKTEKTPYKKTYKEEPSKNLYKFNIAIDEKNIYIRENDSLKLEAYYIAMGFAMVHANIIDNKSLKEFWKENIQ